tara:strand:+ start:4050 stop:4211 length:162 start_codon:yes stop_codon:yes gene_type:complete
MHFLDAQPQISGTRIRKALYENDGVWKYLVPRQLVLKIEELSKLFLDFEPEME